MNLVKAFKCRVYPRASKYISRAILAEGILGGTDQPFRCLFVDNSPFTEYLLRKMYTEQARILRERKIWIPALKGLVRAPMENIDLCIAVLPLRYETALRGFYAFRGQEYVRQIIDTSGTWEEIRKRVHKKKRQIANNIRAKYGLSCRISKDIKDFDFFYHRMHLPHIKKQFGDISEIDRYTEMRQYFLKGFLLLVMSEGQAITGALCHVEDRILTFRRSGVLDGDEAHIKSGAQMALYYFQLRLAKEQNFRTVDTMYCRPFLNDRVYRTKREWGAAVCREYGTDRRVYYFISGYTEKVVSFFENNPAIVKTGNNLMGAVGMNGSSEITEKTRTDLYRRFYAPGLDGLLLLTPRAERPVKLFFNGRTSRLP